MYKRQVSGDLYMDHAFPDYIDDKKKQVAGFDSLCASVSNDCNLYDFTGQRIYEIHAACHGSNTAVSRILFK